MQGLQGVSLAKEFMNTDTVCGENLTQTQTHQVLLLLPPEVSLNSPDSWHTC